jgi:hypothetical protein
MLQEGMCIPCDRVAGLWNLVVGLVAGAGGLVFIGLVTWVWMSTPMTPERKPSKAAVRSVASTAPLLR